MNQESELNAVLSGAVYQPTLEQRLEEIESYYPNRFEIVSSEDNFLTTRDKQTGKIHFSIAGTDIVNDKKRRVRDLATDGLVALGIHQLGNRHKSSDKRLRELIKQHGKDNIVLTGHSLGGTISSDLSLKYGVANHSFNRGGSTQTNYHNSLRMIIPKYRKRRKNNKVYLTKPSVKRGFDPLAISTSSDPLANITFIKQRPLQAEDRGILGAHSIEHFKPQRVKR